MSYKKYRNKKVKRDNIIFDSIKEANYYNKLLLLLKARKISDLILQPKFTLQESFKHNGKTERAITYVADFQYTMDNKTCIVDVKGFKTDIYKIKRKMFLKLYGDKYEFIEI